MITEVEVVKRSARVDNIRGFAIILVLLGHTGIPYSDSVLPFHMPFFFSLSGYLCEKYYDEKSIARTLREKAKRLLVPFTRSSTICGNSNCRYAFNIPDR